MKKQLNENVSLTRAEQDIVHVLKMHPGFIIRNYNDRKRVLDAKINPLLNITQGCYDSLIEKKVLIKTANGYKLGCNA